MGRMVVWCFIVVFTAGLRDSLGLSPAGGCNEALCARIVTKCMLTGSCKCDLQNYTCYKECFACLDFQYDECCSCVEMCPNSKAMSALGKTSHVEEFELSMPGLFQALMSPEPDSEDRWTTFIFPVDYSRKDIALLEKQFEITPVYLEQETDLIKDVVTLNCTVAYLSECMSWVKCKEFCRSTGASSYRWFHDGCCECVGATCRDYGINESRCSECTDSEQVDDGFKDYDYGSEAINTLPTSELDMQATVARRTTQV